MLLALHQQHAVGSLERCVEKASSSPGWLVLTLALTDTRGSALGLKYSAVVKPS